MGVHGVMGMSEATKICTHCEEALPLGEFQPDIRYRGGYRHQCDECREAVDHQRRASWGDEQVAAHRTRGADAGLKHRKRLQELKMVMGCVDCGYAGHPEALDFDHIPERGPKLFGLGAVRMAWATVLVEIAKCDVVCANCHRIRTAERR